MSTLSAFPFIGEQSFATPGAINSPLSTISANIAAINNDVGAVSGVTISPPSGNTIQMPSDLSISGYLSVGKGVSIGTQAPGIAEPVALTIGVNSGISDYIYLNDTANLRSDYLIGSHAGGTADGLNIFDVSGNTMIVSFSKQSIRFYQQVVGPVFDVGGALASTLNAATFGTGADSKESRIQSAIDASSLAGISRVYIPASMYPYSASSISFVYSVQMVREGGNWDVCDVQAYGAFPTLVASSTSAIQEAIRSGSRQDRAVYVPAGAYAVTTLSYYSGSIIRGAGIAGLGPAIAQLYQGSAAAPIFQPSDRTVTTDSFTLEDVVLSAFGNANNGGGIDCTNNVRPSIRRVVFSGTSSYALLLGGGVVGGDAGFGKVEDCIFTNLVNGSTALLLVSTAADQPDGTLFINNYLATSNVTWIASLSSFNRGVDTFVCAYNRFESGTTEVSAMTGRFSNAKVIGNRFEATGSNSTIRVGLNPITVGGTSPCATFVANTWAATGGVVWNDNGFIRSPRWLETETGGIIRNEVWDGGAVQPSYSFRSETSLGLYRSAASTLAVTGATNVAIKNGAVFGRLHTHDGNTFGIGFNWTPGFGVDSAAASGWGITMQNYGGVNEIISFIHIAPGGSGTAIASIDSKGGFAVGAGLATNPGMAFFSETSLGWYRSGASTMALSYGTLRVGELYVTGSGISVGNATAGGTLIPAISSTSSLVAPFVVQGSASSFTVVTWAAAQPGDHILVTPGPTATVSSMSSGLVAHSHCTKAGQIEFRLSNVSTLAQNQSTRTWYFTRISPF